MSDDETYLVWKFHLTSCTDKHLETNMSVLLFSSLLPNIILSANDSMWLVYRLTKGTWKFESDAYFENSIHVEQFLKISMIYHEEKESTCF